MEQKNSAQKTHSGILLPPPLPFLSCSFKLQPWFSIKCKSFFYGYRLLLRASPTMDIWYGPATVLCFEVPLYQFCFDISLFPLDVTPPYYSLLNSDHFPCKTSFSAERWVWPWNKTDGTKERFMFAHCPSFTDLSERLCARLC